MGDEACSMVALVTGGYRGIGLAAVKLLSSRGVRTIFTSIDESEGKLAAEALEKECQLKTHHHTVDVTNIDSINKLARWVKQQFGGLDVLINNAGIAIPDGQLPSLERSQRVIQTNYYGSKSMVEAFLPLLKPGSRIVNVSSSAGSLHFLQGPAAAAWKNTLLDVENMSEDKIDSFIDDFYTASGKGSDALKEQGWAVLDIPIPGFPMEDTSDYCISKMALTAYTRVLAKLHPEILVNALCPGLCSTDITLHVGQSPELGADTVAWLGLECTSSGKFFVKRKEVLDLEHIPLACNDESGETAQEFVQMLLPIFHQRAAYLGLGSSDRLV